MACWTRQTVRSRPVSAALIIDADPAAIQSLKGVLTRYGFQCEVEEDPDQAVSSAQAHEAFLIFLRVELPNKKSGFSICNKLRRNDATGSVPLVMYTSDAPQETIDRHAGLKTHADEYLRLPLDEEALVAALGNHFELPEPVETEDLDLESDCLLYTSDAADE